MSDFSWFLFWALYLVGIFVAVALIISRLRDTIKLYQRRMDDDEELPPEMIWCLLAIVWPAILFPIIPALIVLKILKFCYRVGMGEVDFKRPVRSMRGRFWQVRAKIAHEDG
jgi:hypothetical protein